ncbi:MAG: ferrous iron transport protein B [Fervidicoccaceae archaeon]
MRESDGGTGNMDEKAEKCNIKVLVSGSPNVGKSTFFNVVTGKTVSVANWPGTTVEKKEALLHYKGERICLTDLPGTYNLFSVSLEEEITLKELLFGDYDAVIVLVDSLSAVKSLYFAVQVLELTPKVVIAFTKFDEAHSKGFHIRTEGISQSLGVPVIPISSITKLGVERLLDETLKVARGQITSNRLELKYPAIEDSIKRIEDALSRHEGELKWEKRWVAIKLLEQEKLVSEFVYKRYGEELRLLVEKEIRDYVEKYNRSPREAIISYRYDFVEEIVEKNVMMAKIENPRQRVIEKAFNHPILGPFFATMIYFGIFFVAFTLNTGFPLNFILSSLGKEGWAKVLETYSVSGILSSLFNLLADASRSLFQGRIPDLATSLIADGIIPGVGSVLSFLPLIMISIAFLAILEDSGLGARMAVAYDSVLSKFGLTGKSSFPLLISIGCNVPGVLATRVIEDSSERRALIYSIPFVPCQARLVIMVSIVSALFHSPLIGALAITIAYLISLLVALLTSKLVSMIGSKGSSEERGLLVEIPPLHKPIWKVIWWHVWDNSKHFIKKAGTIIFALSLLIWLMLSISPNLTVTESPSDSIAFYVSTFFSPIGRLYNLGSEASWKTAFMFLNGFLAKEAFIESIALFTPQATSLTDAVATLGYTQQQALAIIIAANLYVPCLATLATMYSEMKSLKGVLLYILYSTSIAILISFVIYRISIFF